jgi:hypothetical protein
MPPEQTDVVQSPLIAHFFPAAHAPQAVPPQSTSVSLPF